MTRTSGVHCGLLFFALVAIGCDQSRSDMGDQPKAETYDASPFFANGTSARPLVAGTVPRDDVSIPGIPYAQHRPIETVGYSEPVSPERSIPFEIDRAVLERGRLEFDINCSVCHGRLGNGNGMIVQRGFSNPPSFHVQRLKDASDAHFYNVITHGYGAMFSYNDHVVPDDRWKIVAYIRALQAAADESTLSPADRAALRPDYDPNPRQGGAR